MTIEKTLERIANAVETIASSGGLVASALPPEEAPPKTRTRSDRPTRKRVGTADEGDPEYTKEMVRAKLQELQKATTPAQAKSILKGHGATTIGNLPASKYKQIIDQCGELLCTDAPY